MSVVLSEHLPLLAGAPNGIQKLRGLILELAVRGKLVPQEPNDEPASELLKRIAKQRKGLAIKQQAPADDDNLFPLATGWKWVRFGDVAQHNSGKTLDKGRNTGQARRYITTSNLYWGQFELGSVREMLIRDDELERCTARKNDLLICEGGEAGRAAVWDSDEEVCFQNHVHRARFFCGINPFYAYRIFQRLDLNGEINKFRKGVGISNLSGKSLASIPFPLPPLAEQHRIVAKVDELMALCDRLEQEVGAGETAHAKLVETLLGTLTQSTDTADLAANWQRLAEHFDTLFTTESSLDALKQTILELAVMGKLVPQDPNDEPASELLKRIAKERARLEAEGKIKKAKPLPPVGEDEQPFEIPDGWVWVRLGKLSEAITSGSRDWAQHYSTNGAIFVRMGNLSRGSYQLRLNNIQYVKAPSDGEGTRTRLQAGDLLLSITGEVGLLGLIPDGFGEAYINQHTCMIRTLAIMQGRFIPEVLRSPLALAQYNEPQRGIKNSYRLTDVYELLIPLPPLAEQHRIVAKVDELMALCDRLKADLAESNIRQDRLATTLIETALKAA